MRLFLCGLMFIITLSGQFASAQTPVNDDFLAIFKKHASVMLLIDPKTKEILRANQAAADLYQYSIAELERLLISDINILNSEQISSELKLAHDNGRNYFIFRHQRKDGSLLRVEVSAQPIRYQNKVVLFSIVREINDQTKLESVINHYQLELEKMVDIQTAQIRKKSDDIIWLMGSAIAVLLCLIWLCLKAYKRGRVARKRASNNEKQLHAMFDSISDSVIFESDDGNVISVNKSASVQFQSSRKHFAPLVVDEVCPLHQNDELTTESEPKAVNLVYRKGNGEQFLGETRSSQVIAETGESLGTIKVIRDISEKKRLDDELKLAANVFSHSSEGIIIADNQGDIIKVNQASNLLFNLSEQQLLQKNIRHIMFSSQHNNELVKVFENLSTLDSWQGEVKITVGADEEKVLNLTLNSIKDSRDNVSQIVGQCYDVTLQKQQREKLQKMAHYDALTNLPNRLLFAEKLHRGMVEVVARGERLAVVYIDLDNFKEANDRWGHDVGDRLLVNFAKRMQACMLHRDTIARLGGDEFVAIVVEKPEQASISEYMASLLAVASQTIEVDGQLIETSASVGVTVYPQEQEIDADQLLRQADQAMYQAKLSGKNKYHLFDAQLDQKIKHQHESIDLVRHALLNDELQLYYQPKVNMQTGEVVGAEALIRWLHPEKGLIPPGDFLPATEESELALEIGEWVIRKALTDLSVLHTQGKKLTVSVNVGAKQLQSRNFYDTLVKLLAEQPRIHPRFLELEVLENVAIGDLQYISRVMQQCVDLGVHFSLDDFGTGYSSLSYLKMLPVKCIKIDKSFVQDILNDSDSHSILKGMLGLAEVFERGVIAEGVESIEQGRALINLGCPLAQGYVIARPMPLIELLSWVERWQAPELWRQGSVQSDLFPSLVSH